MNKKKIIVVISVLLVVIGVGIGIYLYKPTEENKPIFSGTDLSKDSSAVVNMSSNGQLQQLKLAGTLTVEDLKNQFLSVGVDNSNKYMFKPFYNVEQNTEFTFHFNSKVDPIKAITVHTDEKCEYASLVWQMNDAYWTEDGIDVIVKPSSTPVLYTDGRKGEKNNIWGYAPMYYICIKYDLNSKEVKKLEEPIIIPFTVKNQISTPTVYASVDNNGTFSVKWNKVEGAVAYKVYGGSKSSAELSPSESAYNNLFKFITTLEGTELEYNPGIMLEKSLITGSGYEDNTVRKTSEKYDLQVVNHQNENISNHATAIYITAVDANGNESNCGFPVDLSEYRSILPYMVKGLNSTLTELPETVTVQATDLKSTTTYPIDFYKLEQKYDFQCDYRYEVVGTALTGIITYKNESGNYPEEKISTYKINTSSMAQGTMDLIPQVTVDTFADEDYSNSKVDLNKKIDYPADAKVKLDSALVLMLKDKHIARAIIGNANSNTKDPREEFDSFVASDNPEYVLVREGTTITVKKADKSNDETSKIPEKEVNKTPEQEVNKTPEQEIDKTPEQEVNKTPEQENKEPAQEIDNSNYVEEQRKSTEKQVEEGNSEKITGTKYPIFADTPAQAYLALAFINQEKEISLKAFPEYQNVAELQDDVWYVWFQNPYIMGIDMNLFELKDNGLTLLPKYNVSNETAKKYQEAVYEKSQKVASQIIKTNMTDYEKVIAIYDYLENNAEYNYDAVEIELASDAYKAYPNCWNTYGILCEGLGVCQSYAYAFNSIAYFSDLESDMVVGYLGNGLHAWNAVKLSDEWYMVDTTNNYKVAGIPYWVCNASTDYIESASFALLDWFVDGTDFSEYLNDDNKQDWYYKNGLMAENMEEVTDIWMKYSGNSESIAIKYMGKDDPISTDNIRKFALKIQNAGYVLTDFDENWEIMYGNGIICFAKK